MRLVSVILPAYNAEKTIQLAIESVLCQTYQAWELIIIDDGSTDNTAIICKESEKNDNRIKYYQQRNEGPAIARNRGINSAIGEYLSFIDADDTYSPDFLKNMVDAIEHYNCDISICGFTKVSKTNSLVISQPFGNSILDETEYLKYFFKGNPGGVASLWTKLYRRDLIISRNILLDAKMKHGEDWKFNIELLTSGKTKIVAIDRPLYNYFDTQNSITKSYRFDDRYQMFSSASLLFDVIEKTGIKEEIAVRKDVIEGLVFQAKGIAGLSMTGKYRYVKELVCHPMSQSSYKMINQLFLSKKVYILALLIKSRIGFYIFLMFVWLQRVFRARF